MINKKSKDIYCDPKGNMTGYDIAVDVRGILYQQNEKVINYETCFMSSKGGVIPISLSAALIKNELGEIIGAVGIGHDMREYNKLNEEILLNEKMSVLGGVSLELAHKIKDYVAALKKEVWDLYGVMDDKIFNVENKRKFDRCVSTIGLINMRIEEMRKAAQYGSVKIEEVRISDLIIFIDSYADNKNKQKFIIKTSYSQNMCDGILGIDYAKVSDIMDILYHNSVEAMMGYVCDSGLKILIEVWCDDVSAYIGVADNGPGIRVEVRKYIFDLFKNHESTGWGVGLFIAKHLMYKHGGEINYDDSYKEGARFIISIPKKINKS
jgi:signal transduction histidine kinase